MLDKLQFIKDTIKKYGDFTPDDVKSEPIKINKLYGRYFDSEEVLLFKKPYSEAKTDSDDDPYISSIKYEDLTTDKLNKVYELTKKWDEY